MQRNLEFRGLSAFIFSLVSLFLLNGCGGAATDQYGRLPVSGSVALDGQPLKMGTITFVPDPPGPVISEAAISDGKFDIPQEISLPVGKYQVSISCVEEPSGDVEKIMNQAIVGKELVPEIYNTKTELTCEVVQETENIFHFDLKTKTR